MSGVSDLLLGVRSQWGPRLQPLPLDSPVVHLLLQQEAQGGDEGVVVPRPEGIHTLSSKSEALLVCVSVRERSKLVVLVGG